MPAPSLLFCSMRQGLPGGPVSVRHRPRYGGSGIRRAPTRRTAGVAQTGVDLEHLVAIVIVVDVNLLLYAVIGGIQ